MKKIFYISFILFASFKILSAQVDLDEINKNLSRIDFFGDLPSGWKYKDEGNNFSLFMGSYQYTAQDPEGIKYKIYISPKLEKVFNIPELNNSNIESIVGPTGNYSPYNNQSSTGEIGKYINYAHRFIENTGVKVNINVNIENYTSSVEANIRFLAKHIDDKLLFLIQQENMENSIYEMMAPILAGIIALLGIGGIGASMGAFNNLSGIINSFSGGEEIDNEIETDEKQVNSTINQIELVNILAEKCYSNGANVINTSDQYLKNLTTRLDAIEKEILGIDDEISRIMSNNSDLMLNPNYWHYYESCNKAQNSYLAKWEEMDKKYAAYWRSGYIGSNQEDDYSFLDKPNAVLDGIENGVNYQNSLIEKLEDKLSMTDNPSEIEIINNKIKEHKKNIDQIGDDKIAYKGDLNKLREYDSVNKSLKKQLNSIIEKKKRAEQNILKLKSETEYDNLLFKKDEINKELEAFNKSISKNNSQWLKDVKNDYDEKLKRVNNFIKSNKTESKNYESNLTDLIIDLQKAQKRICQAVDYKTVQAEDAKKDAVYNPYDSYEDDVQDLNLARANVHKFEENLSSYQAAYKKGEPGYSSDLINNMQKDINYWKKRVKEVKNIITNNKGKIPKDDYSGSGVSTYGGVGKDAAVDMEKFKNFQLYQDDMSRKVENFLREHPEYGRLRDNLYDENGYVNKDLAMRMMQHNQKHMDDPRNLDVLNSDAYYLSMFANNTSKELFTGLKSDGTTSYLASGFQTLVGISTGGASEYLFTTMNAVYNVEESISQGKTGWQAFSGSIQNILLDEMTSSLMEKPTLIMGDAITKAFPKTTNKIFDFLQKDVKDLLGSNKISPSPLSPKALASKKMMDKALKSGNKEDMLDLYKNHGMENLAELEAKGHISVDDAKKLNDFITKEANESINKGTISSIDEFQRKNNIKIKEVLIGDSGSSAKGSGIRSVKTDADRTTLVVFDEDSIKKYANKYNISPDEAYENLSREYAALHEDHVGDYLAKKGLTKKDVDFGTYDRIIKKSSGGPADTYPTGFTSARQSVSGTTTVYKVDKMGKVKTPYKTSGDALVDQNVLMKTDYGKKGVIDDPLKIKNEELKPLFEQQKMAMNKYNDPKSIAKGLNRANYCTTRAGQQLPDSKLVSMATEIAKNPQKINEILKSNGYSIKSFVDQSKNMMKNFSPTFPRAGA